MSLEKRNYGTMDIIRIPFIYAKKEAAFMGCKYIIDGIVPTLQILATAGFLDAAIAIFSSGKELSTIIRPLFFMAILIAYSWVSRQLSKFATVRITNKLRENFRVELTERVATLKYNHIESQESWDLISRIIKKPETQCSEAYEMMLDMIAVILKVLGILILLFTKVWWSSILIIIISVPLFALSLKSGKEIYEVNREVEKNKRKVEYLGEVLNGREAVEERSLFRYSNKINHHWFKEFETARKEELKVNAKWFIKMKLGAIIISVLSILIVLILVFPTTKGIISIGLFMSVVNSIFNLINHLGWSLPQYGDGLAKNKEYLVDLTKFLELDSNEEYLKKPDKQGLKIKSLEFKNVYFKYPRTENYILKDLSFVIEEGKHYAFVGTNGAGKTTITKLITGLYEDFQGEILINGKSIKEYSQETLKAMTSVVYQDFAKYYVSFKDNISLGDVNKKDNKEEIYKAIEVIDLQDTVEDLPKGIESNLGKIIDDGVDLSGGQWQRVAMARAIVSPATLRILDEPTAALDPISESNIYEKFEKISKGQTTIFISHRLGSTKLANEIFVIDQGKIVERGSYEELLEKGGIYAEMYESQRSWYA